VGRKIRSCQEGGLDIGGGVSEDKSLHHKQRRAIHGERGVFSKSYPITGATFGGDIINLSGIEQIDDVSQKGIRGEG